MKIKKKYFSLDFNFLSSRITYVLLSEVATKALAYLILPIYLILMPKSDFGIFTYYFNIISISVSIFSLGLSSVIIKNISIYSKKTQDLLGIFFMQTLFLIFCVFVFYFFQSFILNQLKLILNLISIKSEHLWIILFVIIFSVFNLLIYSCLLTSKNKKKNFNFYFH